MNRIGKRGRQRIAINRRLKAMWVREGITSCELRLPGCVRTFVMSAAHSKKSRYLITDEDWMTAALACCACHDQIEKLSHSAMESHVLTAIARRSTD